MPTCIISISQSLHTIGEVKNKAHCSNALKSVLVRDDGPACVRYDPCETGTAIAVIEHYLATIQRLDDACKQLMRVADYENVPGALASILKSSSGYDSVVGGLLEDMKEAEASFDKIKIIVVLAISVLG